MSLPTEEDVLNDCKIVLRKLENMKNAVARSNVFMDSRLMMLKLRRARLGAQLAYSRQQSLLAEIELRLAEADLKYEVTRRRQLLYRSHAIRRRRTKSLNVASKKNKATEIDNHEIGKKTTVDSSTQVDEVPDDSEHTVQCSEKTDKAERRKESSSKKRRPEKDPLSKEKAKTSSSSAGRHDTNTMDKATTSKEVSSKPNKKQKTDSHSSADKSEKTNRHNRDSREKRKDKDDSKRPSKKSSKSENKKSAAPSKKPEVHNDKHKDKDSETNRKPAKNRDEAQVKKPNKSVLRDPPTKDICKDDSAVNYNQVSSGNERGEFSEPSLSREVERTPMPVEVESYYVSEPLEVNGDMNIENNTIDETAHSSLDNKCFIFSSCNINKNDAASRPDFNVLCNIIQEMCEASEKEVIDNDFEELGAVKRERSRSISSVETLKL